ncbi:MAG: FkbM family methyltransferase [Gammaproteobacteria bacterium]
MRAAAAHAARLYTLYAPGSAFKQAIIAGDGAFEALHRLDHVPIVSTHVGPRFAIHLPDMIQRALFFCGVWEPTISSWMRHRLGAGDVFVDVGGNIGYHSCLAAHCVGPSGRVVAMEPSPSIARQFAHNVSLNRYANVQLEHCAVSDHETTVQVMRGPPGALGTTRTTETASGDAEATVPARPLGQIVEHDLLFGARMIKIDVEGAEEQVINGVADELANFNERTEWIVELSPGSKDDADAYVRRLLAPFDHAGYRAFAIENRYDTLWYAQDARRLSRAAPESLLRALPANLDAVEQIDVILTRDPALCRGEFAPPQLPVA